MASRSSESSAFRIRTFEYFMSKAPSRLRARPAIPSEKSYLVPRTRWGDHGDAAAGQNPSKMTNIPLYLLAALLLPALASAAVHRATFGPHTAFVLTTPHLEAVVVPSLGRLMSLRLLPNGTNVLWTDLRAAPQGAQGGWVNHGGDKAWPAPESRWGNFTGSKTWLPPKGFDGMPHDGRAEGEAVVIEGPVDPSYGIRVVRTFRASPDRPVLRVRTTFHRVANGTHPGPIRVSVWVISQLDDPRAVYLPVPKGSRFPNGFSALDYHNGPWNNVSIRGNLLRITRDRKTYHKLASDADRMVAIGRDGTLFAVLSRRTTEPSLEFPDGDASAEVYTNPDPKKYVELETLGPLADLEVGGRTSRKSTYALFRARGRGAVRRALRAVGRLG
ncbi:hypothetical protein DFJ74DRAFT_693816 [Hyaloraphidium curvatum]|nr:hypothetical protein DFJ74DRAFT_693816 [Hyaloraphidium curvatum]